VPDSGAATVLLHLVILPTAQRESLDDLRQSNRLKEARVST